MNTDREPTVIEAVTAALDGAGEAHVRELARRVGHSAAAVGRALRRLEEGGVVSSRWVGRSLVYRRSGARAVASSPAGPSRVGRRRVSASFEPGGRPYFLWDLDTSWSEFAEQLKSKDPGTRRWAMERLLNDGRWADIWRFVTPDEVGRELPHLRTRFKEVYQAVIDAATR